MADRRIKELATIVRKLYDKLREGEEEDDETLSKEQILSLLGQEYVRFYSKIVGMLTRTRRVVKVRGSYGGIMLRHAPGLVRKAELTKHDIQIIQSEAKALVDKMGSQRKLEKDNYKPLQEYLLDKGWFNILEISANTRKGKKWKNADLFGVSLTSHLNFHVGVSLKTTAVEVKRDGIRIDYLQQAASCLSFSNMAYLCFFAPDYRGNDLDELIESLKEDEHWQMADQLRIGLIVSYHPTKTKSKLRFQIMREAPYNPVEETAIEDAISKLLTEQQGEHIAGEVREQLRRLVLPPKNTQLE